MAKTGVALLFAVSLFVTGCTADAEKIDHGLVITTIRPYALIADEIAGARLRVETLLPPQISPHTWSPRPGELERVAKAGLIIANGFGLETRLGSFLDRFAARTLYVSSLLGFEEVRSAPEFRRHDTEGDHDAHPVDAGDPHFWTDPSLMIRLADIIAEHFTILDPRGEAVYQANYVQFTNKVHIVDRRIREQVGKYRRRSLITFHDAFMRFFARYGIERIAAIMPLPGREPSAAGLAELGGMIRARGVQALYSEPQLDPKSAEILASEYNLRMYILDPLGAHEGITNYTSLLLFNWEQLQKGFSR